MQLAQGGELQITFDDNGSNLLQRLLSFNFFGIFS